MFCKWPCKSLKFCFHSMRSPDFLLNLTVFLNISYYSFSSGTVPYNLILTFKSWPPSSSTYSLFLEMLHPFPAILETVQPMFYSALNSLRSSHKTPGATSISKTFKSFPWIWWLLSLIKSNYGSPLQATSASPLVSAVCALFFSCN